MTSGYDVQSMHLLDCRTGSAMPRKTSNTTDKHVGRRVRMRRLMLEMTQAALGNALEVSFQQVQKYELGTNRIGASRLEHISRILQVPISFFFDGAPETTAAAKRTSGDAVAPIQLADFMATRDGLALAKAFMQIKSVPIRRRIVALVKEIEQVRNELAINR
jgi:transcriptional regulator with XRE-family HTH domain